SPIFANNNLVISVLLRTDPVRQQQKHKQGMMKNAFYILLTLAAFAACNSNNEPTPDTGYNGYTLVWSDEFDAGISSANWNYELGDGTDYGLPPGWGNAERQLYTSSQNNSLVRADEEGNSVLAIVARKEPGDDRYSSAKLTTQNLHSFRYGRVEARIKVPEGKGMWPAFWMLGDNISEVDWPGCGEIDIVEVIGHAPNVVHSTVHYTNSENKAGSSGESLDAGVNLSDGYHLYRVDWTPESLIFSLDGVQVHEAPIEDDMKEFQRSFYLVLNVAVGGNWPGSPDETTVFPQEMLVDWVRVYSQDGLNAPAPPALDLEEETLGGISTELGPLAFNDALGQFSGIVLKSFGDGGEPDFAESATAIDGDASLLFSFPGESWGGGFFVLEPTVDASQYANGSLKFSLRQPAELADIEIKLESVATAVSLFLRDYTGEDIGDGWLEYTIPMSDFEGLDLTGLKIPFALWNPKDANDEYLKVDILLDNIYFEE
ncbi:MAG: family 16 glycosylhydrolase, partial [Phaeodactylibacter sp.]|nr:family 16 glycosylhydrolase [Phaeodactylibacter sp.]